MKIIITEQQKKSLLEGKLLQEEHNGKTFVSVDIQPEYQNGFGFNIYNYCEYLNENYDDFGALIFFYNGADTLGMISEYDYQMWLLEAGLEEHIVFNSQYYDKGYAFFRYCMDTGVDEEEIINLVSFMDAHDITDSRSVDEDMWQSFMTEYNYDSSEIRDALEFAEDALWIPDVMDELRNYSNIVVTGGGVDECLKEVEIALMALGKSYEVEHKFTY